MYHHGCTIVVCTRNRPRFLEVCLQELRRQYPNLKIVVAESCATSLQTEEIAERWGAVYLRIDEPGAARARNCGFRASDTEIVAFIDDDAVPQPDWLDHLIHEFRDIRVMAVTGSTCLPADMNAEERRVCGLIQNTGIGTSERRVLDRDMKNWFEMVNFGAIGDGMHMTFRREALDRLGGFDERLGPGRLIGSGEETHAFFRLVEQGFRVVLQPKAAVIHPTEHSVKQLWSRYLTNCSAATAYFTLLLVEHPSYRKRVLKYLVQAMLGRRREWRASTEQSGRSRLLRLDVLWAYFKGPLLYFRIRWSPLTQQRQHTSSGRSGE